MQSVAANVKHCPYLTGPPAAQARKILRELVHELGLVNGSYGVLRLPIDVNHAAVARKVRFDLLAREALVHVSDGNLS